MSPTSRKSPEQELRSLHRLGQEHLIGFSIQIEAFGVLVNPKIIDMHSDGALLDLEDEFEKIKNHRILEKIIISYVHMGIDFWLRNVVHADRLRFVLVNLKRWQFVFFQKSLGRREQIAKFRLPYGHSL